MKPGTQVRLISDPSCVGVTTGGKRERGGKTRWQVQFPANSNYVLENQLEVIDEASSRK